MTASDDTQTPLLDRLQSRYPIPICLEAAEEILRLRGLLADSEARVAKMREQSPKLVLGNE